MYSVHYWWENVVLGFADIWALVIGATVTGLLYEVIVFTMDYLDQRKEKGKEHALDKLREAKKGFIFGAIAFCVFWAFDSGVKIPAERHGLIKGELAATESKLKAEENERKSLRYELDAIEATTPKIGREMAIWTPPKDIPSPNPNYGFAKEFVVWVQADVENFALGIAADKPIAGNCMVVNASPKIEYQRDPTNLEKTWGVKIEKLTPRTPVVIILFSITDFKLLNVGRNFG